VTLRPERSEKIGKIIERNLCEASKVVWCDACERPMRRVAHNVMLRFVI